jgi:hypothetical protein
VRVSPQYAQAFQTPTWADATPQPTIVAAPARSSLRVMHVAGFTAERRLAPAALWAASSSRRIPVFASSSKCLVPKDHAEVSAVTGCRHVIGIDIWSIQRLSRPLQPGIRFLRGPLPTSHRQTLRLAVHRSILVEKAGFTTFHINHRNRLGPAYTPVALIVHDAGLASLHSDHVPFGHSDSAPCAARFLTARERRFRYLDRTIRSWLPTALRLAVAV